MPTPVIAVRTTPSLIPSLIPFDGNARRRRFMIVATTVILLVVGVFVSISVASQMH
jgi:hypothetical protein